jgi:hypothetical protein
LFALQWLWDLLLKLNCLQRLGNSLLKLSCLQWINIRCRMVCSTTKLWFTVEVVRIYDSLPELSFLQWISIRCRKRVGCSKVTFAAEIVASATKQFSLLNCVGGSEPVFAAELCSPQRTSFHCWIVRHAASQSSLPISTIDLSSWNGSNACNNFIVLWCKFWNTWMWTYELLKEVWRWMWFKDTNVLICDHWCLRWCGRDMTIVRTRTTRRWSR